MSKKKPIGSKITPTDTSKVNSTTEQEKKTENLSKKILNPSSKDSLIDVSTPHDSLLKKIFIGLSAFILATMIFMSVGAGVNEDDKYQNDYAQALYKYYTTMGNDTTALNYSADKGSMHFYGGFFDISSTFINAALGTNNPDLVSYHSVRHIFNSILGFVAILFTALLARFIGGWYMGIIALIFMFLSPRFIGDSLMNPKDIPFSAGYIMTLYFMSVFFKDMEKPKTQTLVGLGLGIALAISSRIGGLLLIGYMGMFTFIELWRRYGSGFIGNSQVLFKVLKYSALALIGGYLLAMLFWPYGLTNPIKHPLDALSEMTKRAVNIKLLFNGGFVWGQQRPWHYPLTWMYLTIPIFVLSGLLLFFVMIRKIIKDYSVSPFHLIFFTCFFPIFYIIYKNSTLHDSWRHLIFVYPSMVILASAGWYSLIRLASNKKILQYGLVVIIAALLVEPAIFIARNHHYPYVYFNPIAGGVKGAFGKYEMDYWGTSVKQGVEWLEKEGAFKNATEQNPIKVATNSSYVAQVYLTKYGKKVQVIYSKYYQRDEQKWDYGLFISRFMIPDQLSNNNWPIKSYAVHSINANNVPLLSIMKDTDYFAYDGQQFMKNKDFPSAIKAYQKEIDKHPDNELAYLRIGTAYMSIGDFNQGLSNMDKALKIVPNWDNALFMKGLAYQNLNKLDEALEYHLKVIKINERYTPSLQQLAVIYSNQGKHGYAIEYLEKLLEIEQPRKDLYQIAVQIYERAGSHKADSYRKVLQQLK
jgi:tetratricopeptide (TPR) repeat protein